MCMVPTLMIGLKVYVTTAKWMLHHLSEVQRCALHKACISVEQFCCSEDLVNCVIPFSET